jgi:FkbM family methyltransferase
MLAPTMSILRAAKLYVRSKVPYFDRLEEAREQLLLTRQRLAAVEARLALNEEGRTARFPIEFRSQFGEDLWIWDVLGRQTRGFFIELGAFDGYHFSVTYALEAMGWEGLLIEALPRPYAKCRERRPYSRVVNAALGRRGASGAIEFQFVQDQYGGMLSYKDQESQHARAFRHMKKVAVQAQLTWMDELLREHSGPIDAVSIDVEGAELDVLDGFDLRRYRPRVLLLEDNSRGRESALGDYMKSQPYVFAGWLAVNQLYVREDEKGMLERLRRY